MPNRIIKETINESRGLSECSIAAQDLFKRLITYADDYGRFNADIELIRARLYPREFNAIQPIDIEEWLIELAGVGKIAFYTAQPRKEVYGCFPRWTEHQRVRNSKLKIPEPEDTSINDWYLRRFVSINKKYEIIERDNFHCQICGKEICALHNAYALVKQATGIYHIDHIVPVSQGGRATLENLRLTCPECNLSRQRVFTPEDILEETLAADSGKSNQSAASCGEARQVAADSGSRARGIQSNPIQSNPNPIQDICAEPLQVTAPEEDTEEEEDTTPVVKQIELKNGSLYDVTQGYVNELKRAYPDVNVVAELNRMVAWTDANPTKRKTERGIKRFITTWLGRAQDDAKKQGRSRPRAMPSIDDYKSDIDAVTIMRRMEQDKREAANG